MQDNFHYYDDNSLKIHYDKGDKIVKSIKFTNHTFKFSNLKNNKNDDIADLLNDTDYKNVYINIYPIDTIQDIKIKVASIFNVDWYKMTMYWIKNAKEITSLKF